MRELEITPEQHEASVHFAGGVALAFYYELIEGDTSIELLDFSIRYALEDMGFLPSSPLWRNDYFEYVATLIAIERFGEHNAENVSKVISEIIALSVMSVVNLSHPIEVGVIPDPDAEFTVPQEWVDEA